MAHLCCFLISDMLGNKRCPLEILSLTINYLSYQLWFLLCDFSLWLYSCVVSEIHKILKIVPCTTPFHPAICPFFLNTMCSSKTKSGLESGPWEITSKYCKMHLLIGLGCHPCIIRLWLLLYSYIESNALLTMPHILLSTDLVTSK